MVEFILKVKEHSIYKKPKLSSKETMNKSSSISILLLLWFRPQRDITVLKKPSQSHIFHLEPKNDAQDNSSKSYQAISEKSYGHMPQYVKGQKYLWIIVSSFSHSIPRDTYPNLWHDINGSHFMCTDRWLIFYYDETLLLERKMAYKRSPTGEIVSEFSQLRFDFFNYSNIK